MHELRCDGRLHGIIDGKTIEFKCKSVFCGATSGVVVLHKFSTETGELVSTQRFRNPERRPGAAQHHPAAVRSA